MYSSGPRSRMFLVRISLLGSEFQGFGSGGLGFRGLGV